MMVSETAVHLVGQTACWMVQTKAAYLAERSAVQTDEYLDSMMAVWKADSTVHSMVAMMAALMAACSVIKTASHSAVCSAVQKDTSMAG